MPTETPVPNRSDEILKRVIDPDKPGDLSDELAAHILTLGFTKKDQARMAELAEKSNEGTLTPQERAELTCYVQAGNFLAVLQSKARRALRRVGTPSAKTLAGVRTKSRANGHR